jgi:hypothetical protein
MERKLMVFKNERPLLFTFLLLAIVPMLLLQQLAFGTTNAFDQGYQNGRNDYLDGYAKDPYCDPDNSASNPDAFCAAYKAGYEAGWLSASLLYGNQ